MRVRSGVIVGLAAVLSVAVSGQDYRKLVGRHEQFCGVVQQVVTLDRKTCDVALMLTTPFAKVKVQALIERSARARFSKRPEEFLFHEVCASGLVEERKKQPLIRLTDPQQLTVKNATEPFAPGVARPCDEGAELPVPIKEVRPVYTRQAVRDKARGIVEVEIVVGTDGRAGATRIIRTLHPDLDLAALAALRQWHFKPATLHGTPVAMVVQVEMTFTLR